MSNSWYSHHKTVKNQAGQQNGVETQQLTKSFCRHKRSFAALAATGAWRELGGRWQWTRPLYKEIGWNLKPVLKDAINTRNPKNDMIEIYVYINICHWQFQTKSIPPHNPAWLVDYADWSQPRASRDSATSYCTQSQIIGVNHSDTNVYKSRIKLQKTLVTTTKHKL